MKSRRAMRFTGIALVALGVQSAPAPCQDYPSKPIRMIVGNPAGMGQDVEARQFAAQLSAEFGQPIVVENRPGALGTLALEALAKAPPDGYTIAFGAIGTLAVNPRLYERAERELAPVSLVIRHPWLLYLHPSVPAKTLQELIALAKAKPDTISYASTGIGSLQHLSGEWLRQLTGARLKHVPYGNTNWLTDVVAGHVDGAFYPLINLVEHARSGKLRALAVANRNERTAQLPDVPTFAEAGVPEFEAGAWAGLLAPIAAPKEIVQKLAAASARAVHRPPFVEFTAKIGAKPVGSSPAEFEAFLQSERARWRKVIVDAGLKLE